MPRTTYSQETRNRAAKEPERVARMKALLEKYKKDGRSAPRG